MGTQEAPPAAAAAAAAWAINGAAGGRLPQSARPACGQQAPGAVAGRRAVGTRCYDSGGDPRTGACACGPRLVRLGRRGRGERGGGEGCGPALTLCSPPARRMQGAGKALHELLVSAQRRGCLTAGVYESAKLMNVDPDIVTFCVLATDEEDEGDIALQIHFTLIQAFCCENDIDIVRVNDVAKLAAIVGPSEESGEPRDLHCLLITVGVRREASGAGRAVLPGRARLRCRPLHGVVGALRGWPHLPLVVGSPSGQRKGARHTPYSQSAEWWW
uniref:Growth arrest and DNA damage inducible gamma n=1 Tax=Accipiter nisus TaxID=211598 RepID=A0A8B9M097_9AVES